MLNITNLFVLKILKTLFADHTYEDLNKLMFIKLKSESQINTVFDLNF